MSYLFKSSSINNYESATKCIDVHSHIGVQLVAVPPEVSVSATQTRITVGQSTILTCSIIASNPNDPTFAWSFTDTSGVTTILSGETGQTLQLSNIAENEFGTYICNAINSANLSGTVNIIIEQGCKDNVPAMH